MRNFNLPQLWPRTNVKNKLNMTTENYKSIVKKLKFEGRAFINGKYVDAIDGKKFENINPATGEVALLL